MVLTYQDGELTGWERSKLCKLTDQQKAAFLAIYPWAETDLESLPAKGLLVEKIEQKAGQTVNEKVALFCAVYGKYSEDAYKVLKTEGLMLSEIEVTADLVKAYMLCTEWWSKPKSIGGFVKNINAVRRLVASEGKPKNEFPNEWSKEIQNRYEGQKLQEYWAHLRSLGMKPVRSGITKQVIRWE
jgi:hypothetical protein